MDNQRPEITDPSYQDKDIHIPIVTAIVVIALVVTALTFVGMRKMIVKYNNHFSQVQETVVSPVLGGRELPPAPLLQVNEPADLETHRAEEDSKLDGYKWVDQAAGTVQIPVERAMQLVAERGLPFGTPEPAPDEPADTEVEEPVDVAAKPAAVEEASTVVEESVHPDTDPVEIEAEASAAVEDSADSDSDSDSDSESVAVEESADSDSDSDSEPVAVEEDAAADVPAHPEASK